MLCFNFSLTPSTLSVIFFTDKYFFLFPTIREYKSFLTVESLFFAIIDVAKKLLKLGLPFYYCLFQRKHFCISKVFWHGQTVHVIVQQIERQSLEISTVESFTVLDALKLSVVSVLPFY